MAKRLSNLNKNLPQNEYADENDKKLDEKPHQIYDHKKKLPFEEYARLPKWECVYCWVVVIATVIFAGSRIYVASRDYKWDNGSGIYVEHNLPLFGKLRKDTTNWEWRNWVPYIQTMLPWFIGHSLLFNVSETMLSQTLWKALMLSYWLLACLVIYGPLLLTGVVTSGLLIYCTMRLAGRRKICVWMISGVLLHFGLNCDEWMPESINYYVVMTFISYKLVQFVSFTLEECAYQRPENANFWQGLYNMYWYAFYLPYLNSLIVIYKTFPDQLEKRTNWKTRDWSKVTWFGLRMIFWYLFNELFLHFMYFDALMTDYEFLKRCPKNTLVCLGYALGQFFQMKYVLIFGVPAFFAKVDNMKPLDGPICISRVMLYTKIWRYFDRGLYQFFKEYIFLPICRPTFSLPRILLGVFISYGFVLLWHGFEHQYIVWIVLNISELFLEHAAKAVYALPAVRKFRKEHLSDLWFRRIMAWLYIVPYGISLHAIFYFLADSEAGYIFVERIFLQETIRLGFPFLMLIFWLGIKATS